LRCLIVDDNADFLASAQGLLSAQGVQIVATATTGQEALQLVQKHRPDVALVDVQLCEENGIELAGRLATGPGGVHVILISTHPEEDLVDLTADTPAIGFLAKSALSSTAIRALLANAPPDR
jgi:DNA-binding NarL/FixJ family response regulator